MDADDGNDNSFLGRPFDSYQNMRQISACVREAARQMSIPRPSVLELSRRATGLADFLPDAAITRYPTHKDDQPTLREPIVLPYPDKAFQACLVSDVYEHIPQQMRPGLLSEMLRVSDGLVLVATPNGNEFVSKLDMLVFDFIWGKYGERFEPLKQHIEFGVEPVEQIVETLKSQGADRVTVLPANYVYRWIHLILIYFDVQHRNAHAQLFEPFNRIYNQRLSPYDYREPCYRYLIAISTNKGVDVDALNRVLLKPPEEPASLSETEDLIVRTFRGIDAASADQLRRNALEIEKLHKRIQSLTRDINALESGRNRFASRLRSRFQRLLKRK